MAFSKSHMPVFVFTVDRYEILVGLKYYFQRVAKNLIEISGWFPRPPDRVTLDTVGHRQVGDFHCK